MALTARRLRELMTAEYRIEVITFDQLLRIAARVLDVFESKTMQEIVPNDGDIPF
ncbi:hypothetical protein GOV10_01755 [Candidatus Woesearchaeota archaeon]|nr:hypothetical protein [Candidatus Woesearchaeota archaeon]